ncbi:MAG: MBL fold metallo-hydrolase [Thaumarchaeota archaeon]|nr:MBL fold metallo-hydrolase [Nitrososphaerota archaeon]
MTKISFFGGVNEIGGNKILIQDRSGDASVFLDFGMNFARHGMYFEEFIQPRTSNGIVDYLDMGLLPRVDGIYRHDLLEFAGMPKHGDPIADAIILSHAHLDHAGHIAFIDERVPIYCSELTHAILKVLHETQSRSIDSEVIDFKKRPLHNSRDEPVRRDFRLVKKEFKVNGISIEMIPVDHSVPGACGMIIRTSDQTIAYSGDLRLHGTHGHLTQEFVERLAVEKPDIFLCEGTRIDQADKHGEAYVKVNSDKAIAGTKGLVTADYAWKDTTRFKTFFDIAKDTGRRFCISFREAYYIRELSKFIPDLPDINDDNILLYQRKQKTGTYKDTDYDKEEREFLNMKNTVRADYVNKHQDEIVMELSYFGLPELIDLKPNPGSLYIKSASEAFNEEQEFDLERLKRWLGHFKMEYANFHASGHAPQEDLKKVMEGSNAKKIVPIHTDHPELFPQVVKTGARIELPTASY